MEQDNIGSLLHLYEDGAFSRRDLIERLVKYTGSTAAATAVVAEAGLLHAQQQACPAGVKVAENDPAIEANNINLHGEGGTLYAYMVTPRGAAGPRPGVVVIHENRGLNDHIKDVTRRVAKAGYVALGIDLLSRQGGTDRYPDPADAAAAYGRTRPEERREDILSAVMTLRDQRYVIGDRIGVVGFCAGGGNVFDLAVNTDKLAAAVVFYGTPPNPIDLVARLNCPLLGIFAELDRGINARLSILYQALYDQQKRHAIHVYENVRHAFHNDTGPAYDAGAACDAWGKALDFFNRHLNRPAA